MRKSILTHLHDWLTKAVVLYRESSADLKALVRRYPRLENVPLWLAALVTGMISVLLAAAFRAAESYAHQWQVYGWYYAAAPLCFVASWYLVYRFAPEARGSGIPQVMAAVKQFDTRTVEPGSVERLLSLRVMVVKVFSALIVVFGGGAVGREGPTIQIGATLFFQMHLLMRGIFPQLDAEAWIIAGGASGIAAAFNTPLGGLVYAIEELATKRFSQFRTTLISSVMVAGLAALGLAGNYLYFGSPRLEPSTIRDHLLAIGLGLICGAGGSAFGSILYFFSQARKRIQNPWRLAALAFICGALTLVTALLTRPEAAGPGREVVIGFLEGRSVASWDLVIARFINPIFSYLAGGAGGIFAPALAAGASMGSFLATLVPSAHADFFVIMGMIGFLTGITHAPFTSMVLMLEMTDRHSAVFPMMMTAFAAYTIAHFLNPHSFYERMRADFMPTPRT